jgi:hypothetical protein
VLTKEAYMADAHKATTINHVYEKLLKLKVGCCGPREAQLQGARTGACRLACLLRPHSTHTAVVLVCASVPLTPHSSAQPSDQATL